MSKDAKKIAEFVAKKMRNVCFRVKIAGSIRRRKQNPRDIDIVCIPKDKEKLKKTMEKIGKYEQGGEHESTWNVDGINVELYYTDEKECEREVVLSDINKPNGITIIKKESG